MGVRPCARWLRQRQAVVRGFDAPSPNWTTGLLKGTRHLSTAGLPTALLYPRSQKGPLRGASPMTIIISIVSDHGLIQASDSNVTRPGSSMASSDRKVFPLGFTDGALALAGTYEAWNERMDTWMPSCISDYASTDSPTQEGFAYYLKDRLNAGLTRPQRDMATMIQIVGYVSDDDGVHPALHFVRNFSSINTSTGAYEDRRPTFEVSQISGTATTQPPKVQDASAWAGTGATSMERQRVASPSTISGSSSGASWVTCGLSRTGDFGHHNRSMSLHRLLSFRYARSERSTA